MMKKALTVFLLFSLIIINLFANRQKEMEIRVYFEDQNDLENLAALNLNGDIYPNGEAVLYVNSKQFSQIQALGLDYNILREDTSYDGFWENRDLTRDFYHTADEIIALADSLANAFPAICEKHVFGYSVQNRELGALKITDNVTMDENEPEVMFDGGIHGDEVGAAENCIRFARDLCLDYGTDPIITNLIDNREIWIYYMVNPDGRVADNRENANGVDLNRDAGYMWDAWGGSPGAFSQPESKALRNATYSRQFVVHTTYHSGTEFISCPWSYRADQCPDYGHIMDLAGIYSNTSTYANMSYGQGCTGMYPINGSTKDTNYGAAGAISWSMEISYSKHPPASQIQLYYNRNKPAMIAMIEYAGYGLEGVVTDATNGEPIAAAVFINDYFPCYTDPAVGDYHKYVLPGIYDLTIVANGYETQTITDVQVTANNSTATDFQLQPEDGQYIYRIVSSQIPDNNTADEGDTPGIIGAPDNRNYSIGKNGWVIVDMQYPISDGPGNDIKIHEGDTSPESFDCYASDSVDGPWEFLGTGTGTTEFDLAMGSIIEAQYIKIVDDGDGAQTAANAGFDLDAIEALESSPGVYLGLMNYEIDDSAGNNNGRIDPGETVDLSTELRNNGDQLAENTTGTILTTSPYITLDVNTANFGNISPNQTEVAVFTLTADASTPLGTTAEFTLEVSANGGNYTNSFEMEFIVGQIPVVIIDLDENLNSASAMQNALNDLGITSEYLTAFPADLNLYTTVFLALGIYSDNHVLSSGEGTQLADYLDNGGYLYMEGGDTWYFDTQTAVHPMFNINATGDGTSDLGPINGETGTFAESMHYSYSGDNNWMDHIEPTGSAFDFFRNQLPDYGCAVAYDEGSYRTIGTSFEFGGLDDGAFTKEDLMAEYVDFFDLGGTGPNFGYIEGTVTLDGGTGNVEDVEIEVGNLTVNPDASGNYSLELLPGTYDVTATLTGYEPFTAEDVVVEENQITDLNIILEYIPATFDPPSNLQATVVDYNDVELTWEQPSGQGGEFLHHTGYDNNGIGTGGAVDFICAARFDAVELDDFYDVTAITEVKVHIHSGDFSAVSIKVYEGGSFGDPGTEVYSEDITGSVTPADWTVHTLNSPVPLVSGNEYWIGYEISATGDHPASVDAGPMVPDKGAWMYFNGAWDLLTNLGATLDFNWCITGVAAPLNDLSAGRAIRPVRKAQPELPMMRTSAKLEAAFDRPSRRANTIENRETRALSGYKVYRDGAMIEEIMDPNTLTYTDESLDSGTYDYYVIAVYTAPNGESDPSNTAEAEVTLPPPTNAAASSAGTNIMIQWDAPNRSLESYTIYRDDLTDPVATGVTNNFYVHENVPTGNYIYYVTAVYSGGYESDYSNAAIIEGHVDANGILVPTVTELSGNYPNPFNPETQIKFSLKEAANVTLNIYNLKGQKMRTLVDGELSAAYHTITWDGRDDNNNNVSSGVYFYKMRTEEYNSTKKMILMK